MLEVIRIAGLELRFLQSKETTGGSIDLFEMTVDPQGRVPVPHHHATWDETVYGLTGVTTYRIAGADVALEPGNSLFIPRGVIHSFRNESGQSATSLCMLSPGVLGPAYFCEMAALIAGETPDPARLKETMLRHGLIPAPGA